MKKKLEDKIFAIVGEIRKENRLVDEIQRMEILLGRMDLGNRDKLLDICGVPKDTTIEKGVEKGYCRDSWYMFIDKLIDDGANARIIYNLIVEEVNKDNQ